MGLCISSSAACIRVILHHHLLQLVQCNALRVRHRHVHAVTLPQKLFTEEDRHCSVLFSQSPLAPTQRNFPRSALLFKYLGKTGMIGAFTPTIQRFISHIKPAADFLKRALQAAEVFELLLIYFLSWPCHTRPPFSQSVFSPPMYAGHSWPL